MNARTSFAALAVVLAGGCHDDGRAAGGARSIYDTVDTTLAVAEPAPVADRAPLAAIDVSDGVSSPEAIVHDRVADVYLVSNIDGAPHAADDNGFISRIAPDGRVLAARWIDGARADVTLHSPRGMAIAGDVLYVVDLDAVRSFDRVTGAPRASWPIPEPHFPNDLRVAPDGSVLVTETGIRLAPDGPVPDGDGVIWRFDPQGRPTAVARGPALEGPNGIVLTAGGIVTASFLGRDLVRTVDGEPRPFAHLPARELDGLVELPDGSFLVTSWESRSLYQVSADGTQVRTVMHDASFVGAASIDYDAGRRRVLIPFVLSNLLRFEPFDPAAAAAAR